MCGVGAGRWMAMRLEGIVLLLLAAAIILAVFTTDAGKLLISNSSFSVSC